jgi:hypothetical protein
MLTKSLSILLLICFTTVHLKAQQFYFIQYNNPPNSEIWLMDLGTCTTSPVITGFQGYIEDFVEIPGGFLILESPNSSVRRFYFYDTTTGTSTLLSTLTGYGNWNKLKLLNNSEVLWASSGSFYIYNFITNQITILFTGSILWPHALFESNGQLYYLESSTSLQDRKLFTINITPSFSKTLVAHLPDNNPEQSSLIDLVEACDAVFYMYQGTTFNWNVNNYTSGPICQVPFVQSLYTTAPLLNATSGPRCGCTTDAGTWNWNLLNPPNNFIEVCGESNIVLPHNNNATLNSGQNLSFALSPIFSADPLLLLNPDSIVHIYSTTTLNFIPGVTELNTFYYLIPVASASPPGTINLNDPCFDIQYPLVVRWRSPVVNFTLSNPNACGNECRTVQVTFSGMPPFQLTYTVAFSTGTTQTFSQTFPSSSGTIQACPPPGMGNGTINIQATSLTDGSNCSCN